jgi:tetratricopeptide (TPR) repeat protein
MRRLVPIALAALVACTATRAYLSNPGPWDRVPTGWLESLRAARLDFDRGHPVEALGRVDGLAESGPDILPVRVFLQEIELAVLAREGRLRSLTPEGKSPTASLFAQYQARGEAEPTVAGYVLAARLAPDAETALALLEEGEALQEGCVWVHYGRAWWYHSLRRFKEARDELRSAQRLDAGHLPSMRLEATMLAGAGDLDKAVGALRVWLDRTAGSPLVAGRDRADALLDLAALEVLRDHPGRALDLLAELDPRAVRDPARTETVRAAAHEARGETAQALAAVGRAIELDPHGILPLVQEALLLTGSGDTERAVEAWRRVVATADAAEIVDPEEIDFESALFRLQAHAHLERLLGTQP